MNYLNLATIRWCTESEGPGRRIAIWVQGCYKKCIGCCNPEMQAIKENIIISTKDLKQKIKEHMADKEVEGITFLGGEPIIQTEGILDITKWCKKNGLSVMLFTGYTYEELKMFNKSSINELIEHLDILVDGPYIQEMIDNDRPWIGSKNQNVFYLSDRYDDQIEINSKYDSMEFLISEKDILINGWPF